MIPKDLSAVLSIKICIWATLILVVAAGCSREQQKNRTVPSTSRFEVVSTTTVLSTLSDLEQLQHDAPTSDHVPGSQLIFSELGQGVAYVVEKNSRFQVVHNGLAGKPYEKIERLSLSQDGQRLAYSVPVGGRWRLVVDGKEGKDFDELGGEPAFSPDGKHVVYEARLGGHWHTVVDDAIGPGCLSYYDKPVFSADSKKIAYYENTGDDSHKRLVVNDLAFKNPSVKESIGNVVIISKDKKRLAAIRVQKDRQQVIVFNFDQPDLVREGPLYDRVGLLSFGADGGSLAYAAARGGNHYVVLDSKEEPLPVGDIVGLPVVNPVHNGVGALMVFKNRFFLHQAFAQKVVVEQYYDEASDLVYSRDGGLYAHTARNGKSWFIVINGRKGPAFDRVVTPLFSPDGRFVAYRARKDGKRFVVVAEVSGTGYKQFPAYEMVFQPVFTAAGNSVAYGVKEGRQFIWKVEKL